MKSYDYILELTSHDPCRTTLVYVDYRTDKSQWKTFYTVTTDESGPKPIVSYKNENGIVFATLEWRTGLPDRIQVGSEERILVGKWLKKHGFVKEPCVVFS